jgi:hypothetical protein
LLEAHLLDNKPGYINYFYDIDMFDYPALPECLTKLVAPAPTLELV